MQVRKLTKLTLSVLAHSVALQQQFSIFLLFSTAELSVLLLGVQKFQPISNVLALNIVKVALYVGQ